MNDKFLIISFKPYHSTAAEEEEQILFIAPPRGHEDNKCTEEGKIGAVWTNRRQLKKIF